ncbi:zinc finger BED domain-containing protein RICESLEEPER 2-like [Ipomoea triloba]|uniref:zinc finger BED domain-containing protein RICESLEEPER 2-like n=1 Tax=Ipomoea triloba TaxID=35885 RepID=UPI00125D0F76|nr:zinc finger BED domain-containing protein RICESLEEPER 2-like [Ipomoea triloba]
MVHERPFSIVEDEVFMWAFEYANSNFKKVTRKTARSDCLQLYEAKKNTLKKILSNVSKVSITTDMWKSSHQVVEYMVVTGHFVDASWNLQKRVLNFVKVPPPRRGTDIANAIFKCLRGWGIENKIFSVTVDNASYNDSCVRSLKENMSLSSKMVLDGQLFYVRCCAHILNLLVQDGLSTIKDVILNVRESVKFINSSDARLKSFHEVVELKGLKERKLVLDCPTRWNSTYLMLCTTAKFKHAFSDYNEKEPHYKYAPSFEDWNKIEKVCQLLEVFNDATHVISGSDYPTSNLYLAEIQRVKKAIDNAAESFDMFMSEMAIPMKAKFDKYWGECNLLMSIACVLDPMMKLNGIKITFPLLYKTQSDVEKNVEKVKRALEELYLDYVNLFSQDASSTSGHSEFNVESTIVVHGVRQMDKGMQEILTMVHRSQSYPLTKSELETYLEKNLVIHSCSSSSFCALGWWKDNSLKFKVLSKMAANILVVPISSVASESTFSAGRRVIDEYCASLNEQSIEALICGGDWLRNKYGLKIKEKEDSGQEEIMLKP